MHVHPHFTKDRSRRHGNGTKCFQEKVTGYALNFGGGWPGDLIIAHWRDMENHVASEVHVSRFNSKAVGIKKLQDAFVFPCGVVSLKQEGHAQRQTMRHPKNSKISTRREPSTLTLAVHKEPIFARRRRGCGFSEAPRDASEAREDLGSSYGNFYRPTLSSENICTYQQSPFH